MKLNFTYADELYHFGVKGMKWGVRKAIQKHRNKKDIKKAIDKGIDDYYEAYDFYGSSKTPKQRLKKFEQKLTKGPLVREALKMQESRRKLLNDPTYDISKEDYALAEGGFFKSKNYNRLKKLKKGN